MNRRVMGNIELTRIQVGNLISYLPVVGVLVLLGTIPFLYGNVQRIALYWIAATYPLDYIVNKRWRGWKWTQAKWTYVAFIAFFCLIPIWQLFDPIRTSLYQFTIERYMPFLVVGVCGLAGMTDKLRIEYAAWVMLSVSAGIVAYLLYRAELPDFANFETWAKHFNQLRAMEVNTHMTINLYFNLSIVLGLYTILQSKYAWWVKVLTGVMMLPILFAFSFTEGRTGVLTFLGIVMLTLMYYVSKASLVAEYMYHRVREWRCLVPFATGAVSSGCNGGKSTYLYMECNGRGDSGASAMGARRVLSKGRFCKEGISERRFPETLCTWISCRRRTSSWSGKDGYHAPA